ncbi:DUF6514 family protein [Clostridium sp. D33t1_170424_F3]|uniref:DUF6514 family protein n=1 Tax=Clostridium sp. D33t1_170424_F3 TaxID=2787099 RepID=UPI0018AC5DB9|nr:DUF6514 family protein [Clostridium sp. D33t1_170424_F3]
MIRYRAEKRTFQAENATPYESYCLSCERNGTLILQIADLSFSGPSVEQLAEQCNRLGLSPLHLRDVAEDFLAQGLSDGTPL